MEHAPVVEPRGLSGPETRSREAEAGDALELGFDPNANPLIHFDWSRGDFFFL